MKIFVTKTGTLSSKNISYFLVMGNHIIISKVKNSYYANAAYCPHSGAPLKDGCIIEDLIICPWHRSIFKVENGKNVNGPSVVPIKNYPVCVENDCIYIEIDN